MNKRYALLRKLKVPYKSGENWLLESQHIS